MGKPVLRPRRSALAWALASVLLGPGCGPRDVQTTPAGDGPPRLVLEPAPQPAGADQSFAQTVAGRVVVVDFWASWCVPCRAAIPQLVRLHATLGDQGLVVVGVDVGEDPAVVSAFAREAGITYPVFVDPRFEFADAMAAREVPTLLVVAPDGTVVRRQHRLDAAAIAEIRRLLAEAR